MQCRQVFVFIGCRCEQHSRRKHNYIQLANHMVHCSSTVSEGRGADVYMNSAFVELLVFDKAELLQVSVWLKFYWDEGKKWHELSFSKWLCVLALKLDFTSQSLKESAFFFFLLSVPLSSSRWEDRQHSINCTCSNEEETSRAQPR